MNVKLVLLKKVYNLGGKGDIVNVCKGYARNFLLPQNLAKIVNQKEIDIIEKEKERQKAKIQERLSEFENFKQKLDRKRISIKQKSTSTGRLYASVQAEDLARAIYQTYGFHLPVEFIKTDPIKSLGLHTFKVVLPGSRESSAQSKEVLMKVNVIEHRATAK